MIFNLELMRTVVILCVNFVDDASFDLEAYMRVRDQLWDKHSEKMLEGWYKKKIKRQRVIFAVNVFTAACAFFKISINLCVVHK